MATDSVSPSPSPTPLGKSRQVLVLLRPNYHAFLNLTHASRATSMVPVDMSSATATVQSAIDKSSSPTIESEAGAGDDSVANAKPDRTRPGNTRRKAKRAASPEWPVSPFGLQYELELLDRVQCLTTLVDPTSNRYGLTKIPQDATWGSEESRLDDVLCHDGRPVIALLIGETENASFFDDISQPLKFVRMAIKPMYHADVVAAHRLITHLSVNVKKEEDLQFGIVEAGRRQARREKNGRHTIAYKFRHAYDASEQYGPKSVMPKIRAKDIGYRDLVIVECKVVRFRVESDTGKAIYLAKKWSSWRVRLDMVSVCRLNECTDDVGSDSAEEDGAIPVI